MNKQQIIVPKGINFLSDWNEFSLPDFPCILNKQITGCGFTQWCLTSNQNIILCSPRRMLLENKTDWYIENFNENESTFLMYYAKNDYEIIDSYDKDTSREIRGKSPSFMKKDVPIVMSKEYIQEYNLNLKNFVTRCQFTGKYCKILVTYDSFRKVKDVLTEMGVFDRFHVVIDEMQSIFVDSSFKSTTELEFVNFLQDTPKICYVSATPMMDEYLDEMDEFKDLPYYEMDWGVEDPGRIIQPKINKHDSKRIIAEACEIVIKYRTGSWKESDNNSIRRLAEDGTIQEFHSREAVFYINSVKNICDIIKKCGLKQEECNILCAKTEANKKKIQAAFGVKKADFQGIGKVPSKKDMSKNKMFTFCTRTVYLGADFWSDNARSFVFSDANKRCLTVDIALDLPQILGRQRNEDNPWKYTLEFYYIPTRLDRCMTQVEFDEYMKKKIKITKGILECFNQAIEDKNDYGAEGLINTYRRSAKSINYDDDFVAVNEHCGSYPILAFNDYVRISEKRSYAIAQGDYINGCYIRSAINRQFYLNSGDLGKLAEMYQANRYFPDRIKFVCEYLEKFPMEEERMSYVADDYVMNYYRVLGPKRIKSLSYNRFDMEREIERLKNNQTKDVSSLIYSKFSEGNKYSNVYIKGKLKDLYNSIGYQKTAKATDLGEYFEIKAVNYIENGKKTHGLELLKKKK